MTLDQIQAALAAKIGDDIAAAVFEPLYGTFKMYPEGQVKAANNLLRRNGFDGVLKVTIKDDENVWRIDASGVQPPVGAPAVVPGPNRAEPALAKRVEPNRVETLAASARRKPRKRRVPNAKSRKLRRWSGKLNPEVYVHYFPVPLAAGLTGGAAREAAEEAITEMFAATPAPALKLYLYACRKADKDGVFDLSAAIARKVRGVERREGTRSQAGGDPYLKLLCDAGLFEQLTSGGADRGGQRTASEYKLVPYSAELKERAVRAFSARANQSAERLSRDGVKNRTFDGLT